MRLTFAQKLVVGMFVLLAVTAGIAALVVKPPSKYTAKIGVLKGCFTLYTVAEDAGIEAPYYAAEKTYLLGAKVVYYDSLDGIVEGLLNGTIDAAVLRIGDAAELLLDNVSVRIVGAELPLNQIILAPEDSNISSIEVLANTSIRKLGYTEPDTLAVFNALMEKAFNHTVGEPVRLEKLDAGEALAEGSVDVLLADQPWGAVLLEEYNFTVTGVLSELAAKALDTGDAPLTVIVVKKSLPEDNPDLVEALLDLWRSARNEWTRNVPAAEKILVEKYNVPEKASLKAYYYLNPLDDPALSEATIKALRELWSALYNAGLLPGDPSSIPDSAFWTP